MRLLRTERRTSLRQSTGEHHEPRCRSNGWTASPTRLRVPSDFVPPTDAVLCPIPISQRFGTHRSGPARRRGCRDQLFALCRSYLEIVARARSRRGCGRRSMPPTWCRRRCWRPFAISSVSAAIASRVAGLAEADPGPQHGRFRGALSRHGQAAGAAGSTDPSPQDPRTPSVRPSRRPPARPPARNSCKSMTSCVCRGLGPIAGRLSGGHCVAEPPAAAVQRGGRAHGAFPPRRADALDAGDQEAARAMEC